MKKIFPYFFIFLIWIIFSSPFLFFGKTPYPSNYQVNFFSPWNSYPGLAGPVKNNAQPDIIGQIYPWRYFDIQQLKKGQIPLWNPYSFSGTPHLANYQSAALFPLNLLFFLPFSFINIWSLLVILQPLFAGIFMYILMRKLSVSRLSGLLSSLSFMFCGFIVTWMGYATLGYAIIPLPLALFCIHAYEEHKKLKYLVLLSLTFPLSFFAGHFQTSIYFALAVFAYLIYNFIVEQKKSVYAKAFLFSLFGLLLTSPQVLPSIELYSQSLRSGLFQKIEAIPWNYLPTLFSPDFYGNPVTRNDWFGHYAEWNGFAGVVPLIFAFFAVVFKMSRRVFFFLLLALFSIFLAFDTPLLSLLVFLKIPVISTSAASRIIVLFSFSIAILAGIGLDQVLEFIYKKRRRVFLSLGLILLLFVLVLLIPYINLAPDKAHIALKNSVLPGLIILGLFISTFLFAFSKSKKFVTIYILIVLLFCSFEMTRFASKWQSFDSKNLVYINVGIVNFYNKQNHIDRAVGLSGAEDAMYYNMPILTGYDPLYATRYGEFMKYVDSGKALEPARSVVNFPLNGKYTPQLINFMGVKFIVHKFSDGSFPWAFPFAKYPPSQFTKIYDDSNYLVYKNNYVFDRAFIVSDVVTMEKNEEILDKMFSSDLRKIAFVEEKIGKIDSKVEGSAKIIDYQPNKITITVESTGSAILILTDNYYPGWKAYVNGVLSKIYRTDYTFRGVVVPKGKSIVEFNYQPESFRNGLILFVLGILGIILSIGIYRKKDKL